MIDNGFRVEEPLPQRPDSRTGSPRPPRAPVEFGHDEKEAPGERSERFKPAPPPGQGPVLEWYEPSTGESLKAGLMGVVGAPLFMTIFLALVVPGWMLLFIPPVTGAIALLRKQTDSSAAGADWFAAKKRWVRIYELRSVAVSEPLGQSMLALEDGSGGKVRIRLETAQKNRDLWDFVYNGILHSVVAGGAAANQPTRSKLGLPKQLEHLTIRGIDP